MRTWRLNKNTVEYFKAEKSVLAEVTDEVQRQADEGGEDVHLCDHEGNVLYTAHPHVVTPVDWNEACRWERNRMPNDGRWGR